MQSTYLFFLFFSAHVHKQLSRHGERPGGCEQAGRVLSVMNRSNEVMLIFFFLSFGWRRVG